MARRKKVPVITFVIIAVATIGLILGIFLALTKTRLNPRASDYGMMRTLTPTTAQGEIDSRWGMMNVSPTPSPQKSLIKF